MAKKRRHKSLEDRLADASTQQKKLELQKKIRDMQAELKAIRKGA
jgi:hypothetical protein